MKEETPPPLDGYLAEAGSWARDRHDGLRQSRRVAWAVAGGLGLIALCEALALVLLMPLKTVVPYTLLVDRQTGFVQALRPLDPQLVSADAALTQSFLVQYVLAREGYDYGSAQSDYRKVALWSQGQARADYLAAVQASNPDSPLSLYPRSTIVDVQVKSVTPMARNVAMVRFDTRRRDAGGQAQPPRSWIAVARYGYSGAPMSLADRFVNPLGFQVVHYRRSMEVLPQPEPSMNTAPQAFTAPPATGAAMPPGYTRGAVRAMPPERR